MPALLRKLKKWGARGLHFGIVALFTIFAAFPFYWMLVTTFKRTSDLMNTKNNPFLFNQPPTLEHLRVLFFETLYGKLLLNTFFFCLRGCTADGSGTPSSWVSSWWSSPSSLLSRRPTASPD